MKKRSLKVSLLVPIYNAAPFLKVCLESLRAQTLKEMEILCLDDGSSDDSVAIVRDFVKRDRRFVLIEGKENRGYGTVMNRGLTVAQGEYVGVVEADDFVDAGMCSELYTAARVHRADIAKANYYIYARELDWRASLLPVNQEQGHLSSVQMEYLATRPATIWTALYRRQFLQDKDIKFMEGHSARFQDTSFAFKAMATANRVYFTPQAFYHFRQHPGQMTHSQRSPEAIVGEYREVERFLDERKLINDWKASLTLAKLHAYETNVGRLSWTAARALVRVIQKDLARMDKRGIFETRLYTGADWWSGWLVQHWSDGFIAWSKIAHYRERV